MIPKITQDAPNIVPRYWCSTCGRSLPAPDQHDDQWRFCPRCGEPIEYEKAEPVQWREQNCEKCGRPLIQLVQDRRPFFRSNYEFVGASLCRDCLEEHCVKTNCLQCDIGNWPGCRYVDIKRQGLQKAKEGGENDVCSTQGGHRPFHWPLRFPE